MENNELITSREQLSKEVNAIFARTDWSRVGGQVKAHEAKDKETKEKTGEVTGMYATLDLRFPGTQPVTIDGETFYSKNVSLRVNAFKLAPDADTVQAAKPAAKAATISGSALKAQLASLVAKPASAAIQ